MNLKTQGLCFAFFYAFFRLNNCRIKAFFICLKALKILMWVRKMYFFVISPKVDTILTIKYANSSIIR